MKQQYSAEMAKQEFADVSVSLSTCSDMLNYLQDFVFKGNVFNSICNQDEPEAAQAFAAFQWMKANYDILLHSTAITAEMIELLCGTICRIRNNI